MPSFKLSDFILKRDARFLHFYSSAAFKRICIKVLQGKLIKGLNFQIKYFYGNVKLPLIYFYEAYVKANAELRFKANAELRFRLD